MGGRTGWLGFMLLLALPALGCGEPQCPHGYFKEAKVCRRIADAGNPAQSGDAESDTEEGAPGDASQNTESGVMLMDAAPRPDATGVEASLSDSSTSPAALALDAETPADVGRPILAVECDATRACPQSGYQCIGGKCSATCAQTQCDPHAVCGMDGNQRPQCVCGAGYTGDGKTCTALSCPPLRAPEHGSVSRLTGSVGDEVTYACDVGYELAGATKRRCEVNGQWTAGAEPSCAAKRCAMLLTSPTHGSVQVANPVYPNAAVYSCDPGFALEGSATRQCQATGEWAGSTPRCKGCGDGVVDPGEDCEPNASNAWTCDEKCKKRSTYLWCSTNVWVGPDLQGKECPPGHTCFFGQCVLQGCTMTSECPTAPTGKQLCHGNDCAAICDQDSDCPAGMFCSTFPSDSGPLRICTGCGQNLPCPNGAVCFQRSADVWGVCP
jgi:Sushi repeat (SCR repeat)